MNWFSLAQLFIFFNVRNKFLTLKKAKVSKLKQLTDLLHKFEVKFESVETVLSLSTSFKCFLYNCIDRFVETTTLGSQFISLDTVFHVHPLLEGLDRLQKWPTVESSLIVYRHVISHFKCLFENIPWVVFEKKHCQFLP